jgi:hypothetical protein
LPDNTFEKKTVPNELVILECPLPPLSPWSSGVPKPNTEANQAAILRQCGPPLAGEGGRSEALRGVTAQTVTNKYFLCYTIFSDSKVVFGINYRYILILCRFQYGKI